MSSDFETISCAQHNASAYEGAPDENMFDNGLPSRLLVNASDTLVAY